jgi:hypothetical protein
METSDKYACAELIQSWGLYRDQGKWPELTATFAPEGEIAVSVRQKIGAALADLTSHARFLDRIVRRDGRWMIVERIAIYERDRLDPVEPSEAFDALFKTSDFSVYPEAYRYMAARLVAAGRALAPVVYRDGSPHTAQLYTRYDAWLSEK